MARIQVQQTLQLQILLQVCDHELTVRLKHPDWKVLLDNELLLCSNDTVKLTRKTRDLNLKKESAKLLSQLSQLSFEELEGEDCKVWQKKYILRLISQSMYYLPPGSSLEGNFFLV